MSRLSNFIMATAFAVCAALPGYAFDTKAKAAYVVDLSTGTVLLDKNADEPRPPASMSKLMTLYVAFEALKSGRLSMDERLPVSQHAMSYGGSTMFLDTTDKVRVEDLIHGVIVLSGNDACVVLAEALSPDGTEAGFARYMTQRAKELGMTHTNLLNSNGWPAEGHVMSVHDLAILAEHLIQDFPEYYPFFSQTEFKFDGRAPKNINNRNPLLKLGIGADGLKTGHTEDAGYGLVGSAVQGDRRLVFVLSGLDSVGARAEEAASIVNWGFRQFDKKEIATAGKELARAKVWMGKQAEVGLTTAKNLTVLVPVLGNGEFKGEVVYDSPLQAPIVAGQQVAMLRFTPEGMPTTEIPLVAATDVPRGGLIARLRALSEHLMGEMFDDSTQSADAQPNASDTGATPDAGAADTKAEEKS